MSQYDMRAIKVWGKFSMKLVELVQDYNILTSGNMDVTPNSSDLFWGYLANTIMGNSFDF